jgi:hypothetical protein
MSVCRKPDDWIGIFVASGVFRGLFCALEVFLLFGYDWLDLRGLGVLMNHRGVCEERKGLQKKRTKLRPCFD